VAARSIRGIVRFRLLHAIALLVVAAAAQAEGRFGGSVSVTNDYLNRGISYTRGAPAIQGGMHVRWPAGWSIGVWASTVNLNRGSGATGEIDLYLSRSWSLDSDWDLSGSVTHYSYLHDSAALPYDYDELIASISYRRQLSATVAWSPNVDRYAGGRPVLDRAATSYEVTYLQPLGASWSANAGLGYYDLSEFFATGYWYWNAGFSYALGSLQMDLAHIGTDDTASQLYGYRSTGRRWSAALTWRF
jgi:uncharacterized protein (TIGR02001 family)